MTLHIMETEDRVEREILVNAPRARVWQALTDSKEFGEWFGARLEGPFAPGQTTRGMNGCHGEDGIPMELKVVRMEPESAFSYTWHPYAIEPGADYSGEEPTLVEFSLEDEGDGTRVRVVESGFSKVPEARREIAFRKHGHGWEVQLKDIAEYVGG